MQETNANSFQKIIDRFVGALNSRQYYKIQQDFSKEILDEISFEKLSYNLKNLSTQYGKIQKIDSPWIIPPTSPIYRVIFPASFESEILDFIIDFNNQGKIIGIQFRPHIPVPEKHETELFLPFKNQWLVFWGGDTKELNAHHYALNQRFAFDFAVVDEGGKTHEKAGKTNEDYYTFGRDVMAPADGFISDIIEGVRDNIPGTLNPYSALGNAVFIQHNEHEVSILAHLKLGSIIVKVGDKVKRGQIIGLCGNSGNTSEPHLHYHLQNTYIIQDGTGVKIYFQELNVTKEGKTDLKLKYSPIKGDIVSPV